MKLLQLRHQMKSILDTNRYLHSIGVEEVSYDLALIYGYDTTKAGIAGVLHDCAKHLTEEELVDECQKFNLPISDEEQQAKYLLHAKVGAIYAQKKYGIEDEDILNAVCYHCTGRPAMSLLEKIVYTADYIEPNRKPIPNLDKIREMAYMDLDKAILMITNNVIEYLKSLDAIIDTTTYKTYEYYRMLIHKKD